MKLNKMQSSETKNDSESTKFRAKLVQNFDTKLTNFRTVQAKPTKRADAHKARQHRNAEGSQHTWIACAGSSSCSRKRKKDRRQLQADQPTARTQQTQLFVVITERTELENKQ